MKGQKKLQVFVSSTYTDLHSERQAAVQAILTAGHIPAGMELFAAGDQSQIHVIRQWIKESDVFLLILGGRYGSVEAESRKSYIHLEYEHAVALGKPLFALVIADDYLTKKARAAKDPKSVIEQEYYAQWKAFREMVLTRLVRFWSDPRDIKLAIMETMGEFIRRDELDGWIRGDEAVNAAPLAEELARLAKENASLRHRLDETLPRYGGLTFSEMYGLLANEDFGVQNLADNIQQMLAELIQEFGDPKPGLLHSVWLLQDDLLSGGPVKTGEVNDRFFGRLQSLGLIVLDDRNQMKLTETGREFLMRLIIEKRNERTRRLHEQFVVVNEQTARGR
jgi:hypothetical protein